MKKKYIIQNSIILLIGVSFLAIALLLVFFNKVDIVQNQNGINSTNGVDTTGKMQLIVFFLMVFLFFVIFFMFDDKEKDYNFYQKLLNPSKNKEFEILKIIDNIVKNQSKNIYRKLPDSLKYKFKKIPKATYWDQNENKKIIFGCYNSQPLESIFIFANSVIKPHGLNFKSLNRFIHDLIFHEFGHSLGKNDQELVKYKFKSQL